MSNYEIGKLKPKKLNELGFLGRGKSKHRPRNDPILYGGIYPFIQTADVKKAELYICDYSQTYNEKGLAQSKLWDENTLCITIAANIAETAILKIKACFPDSIIGFTPDPDKADVKFIKYYIDQIKLSIQSMSKGTTQDNLSLSKLSYIDFFIPTLETQRKISTILSAYDDLIENNNRRIEILEEITQNIYKEWFIKFRYPDHEGVDMIKSDFGIIPEGWRVEKLYELVNTQYGYTESAVDDKIGPKFVRGKDINKNSFIQWDTVPYCPIDEENKQKFELSIGDILVIRMADPGKVGIIEKDIDAVFASYLIRLSLNSQAITPYYLFYFLSSDYYQNYIFGASTGTTRRSASAKVVTDIEMIIPPKEIIKEFESIISPIRQLLNKLLEKNHNLRETRDLLIPKLISSEINVDNIDINIEEVKT